ncbi:helix-turn-helix domain-containing protein [Inquilinus sp. KBS0705]|nr:helix-turn-helix domain-containing protein [Inquilinus sp. KBS0705]
MDKHYGQIVELVIRKNGFSISELARLANINRKCIYNWFNQKYLKPDIIHKIGCFINHDFSVEFPELFVKEDFVKTDNTVSNASLQDDRNRTLWKDKYIELLERYNILLLNQLGH